MPGPANEKGRKKRQNKKQKVQKKESGGTIPNQVDRVQTPPESVPRVEERIAPRNGDTRLPEPKHAVLVPVPEPTPTIPVSSSHPRSAPPPPTAYSTTVTAVPTPHPMGTYDDEGEYDSVDARAEAEIAHLEASASYIYDPGNGPRVRDFLAFLKSPFAAPAVQSFLVVGAPVREPGEEHTEEEQKYTAANIIPILNRFLPGEFATILWFNRTRQTQRICPACQRLYHLADDLPPLIVPAQGEAPEADPEGVKRERELSGICSFPCFALATYNYGPAAVWAYGLLLQQLDEDALDAIESEGSGVDDQGLSTYVRMTRYDGAGLIALLSSAVSSR